MVIYDIFWNCCIGLQFSSKNQVFDRKNCKDLRGCDTTFWNTFIFQFFEAAWHFLIWLYWWHLLWWNLMIYLFIEMYWKILSTYRNVHYKGTFSQVFRQLMLQNYPIWSTNPLKNLTFNIIKLKVASLKVL